MDAERTALPGFLREKMTTESHRVGKVIRKVRIDELPQLFNILKGI